MANIIITDTLIVPVDREQEKDCFKGDLVIEGSKIKEIGVDLKKKYPGFEVISGQHALIMPGFVNCHTHAAMTMLRGYADDMPLQQWLSQKIWPREAHLREEDIYWGSMLSILEMIKSGTTTFADMYFYMDLTARAAAEAGIRTSLSRGMVGIGEKAELAMRESEEFVKKWHGKEDGRITCLLGPHAPYTCPPDYLRGVITLADELQVGLHIHLAETAREVEDISGKYGLTPIRLMDSLGLFEQRHVLAAHCVHLDAGEIRLLAEKRVGIAHNPESNMKLASGIAPVPQLLAAGALVGLGTDGAASNNNLDMLEEMRSCALLHKVNTLDPLAIPARQVLEMATCIGAQALGLQNTGALKTGYRADLIMIDLRQAHLTPLHDPIANIVYAAQSSDIKTVIIDGRVVMRDRCVVTMDEERILHEAAARAYDLVRRQ